jgi:hypothetical protein
MSGWRSLAGADAQLLERELARELPPGHVLKVVGLRAIARRFDRDDIAFKLDDDRLCVVHLTWNVERDPRWPHTEFVTELPEDDGDDLDE